MSEFVLWSFLKKMRTSDNHLVSRRVFGSKSSAGENRFSHIYCATNWPCMEVSWNNAMQCEQWHLLQLQLFSVQGLSFTYSPVRGPVSIDKLQPSSAVKNQDYVVRFDICNRSNFTSRHVSFSLKTVLLSGVVMDHTRSCIRTNTPSAGPCTPAVLYFNGI